MPTIEPHSTSVTAETEPWRQSRFLGVRPSAYIFTVLAAVLFACAYSLRTYSIFGCQASGYGSSRYLGYCGAKNYGDYDHGAFWYGMEPEAINAASNAEVLFLGNSRMQFGLSTATIEDWFASLPVKQYLLGFSYNGNYTFEAPLLRKIHGKAEVYVINVDLFFEQSESPPARAVMRDRGAKTRYEEKRNWQRIHRPVCASVPAICGNQVAFFRSAATGAWVVTGRGFTSKPVSYDRGVDLKLVNAYVASGNEFLSQLEVSRKCVILTMVPTVDTEIGTAKATARGLGLSLIAPELDGLGTFDGSHLDQESARRWSSAFIEAAGPQIRKCLDEARGSPVGS